MKFFGVVIAAVIGLFALYGVTSYFSAAAAGNVAEQGIKAQYEQNKNNLSNYTNSVVEMFQVTTAKSDDLRRVTTEALEGRYGENGSQAVFQWIQENYPGQVTDVLYEKVQNKIEAGRLDFENNQKLLIDKKRSYETDLGYPIKGFWLRLAGYPKINLDEYKIVINSKTQKTFETGIDDPMLLRQPSK